jgi:hypothetical protein
MQLTLITIWHFVLGSLLGHLLALGLLGWLRPGWFFPN